jgi:ABC-type Fe3+-hydroxamate transport system substrate-binding protein
MRPSLLLLLALAACRPATPPDGAAPVSDALTLTDDLGRSVELRLPIDRVIPLAPNLTEIVYATGAGEAVAAAGTSDDYPDAVASVPRVSAIPLDFEAIADRRPGLVLATDQVNSVEDAERLASLGIPVHFFHFDEVRDVPRAMRITGEILGAADSAEVAALAFEDAVATVKERVQDAEPVRALVLVGDEVLYAFGKDSYVSEMVRLAGGEPITDVFEGDAAVLQDEFVLEAEPEAIVVLAGEDYDPAGLLEHHPTWRLLPAFQNDRVLGLDPDWVSRPGPRLPLGLDALARAFHPDRFLSTDSTATP